MNIQGNSFQNTALLKQKCKNLTILKEVRKYTVINSHPHLHMHIQKNYICIFHSSIHGFFSLLWICRCSTMYCVLSPAKHVLYCLGNKTVIFSGCLSVCHHLKIYIPLLKMFICSCQLKLNLLIYLVVTAGALVACTEWSDWARSEMLEGGGATVGGRQRGTAVHHTLTCKVAEKIKYHLTMRVRDIKTNIDHKRHWPCLCRVWLPPWWCHQTLSHL